MTNTFSLPDWVEGALFPSPLITLYYNNSTTPVDLTNASTITGKIKDAGGVVRDIAGTLTVDDADAGTVLWTLDSDDVAAGRNKVQITVNFSSGQTPAKTFIADWYVQKALA